MDSKNNQKIKNYLALAGGITSAFTAANAQVVYTDVNPDYLLTGNFNSYSLDLNNDSFEDFTLTAIDTLISYVSSGYTYNAQITGAALRNPVLSNSWLINTSSGLPNPLSQGDNIGNSGFFASSYSSSVGVPIVAQFDYEYLLNGVTISSYNSTFGDFSFDQEGILGLKFNINGSIHYGWARIEVTSSGSISIKDYAYESTPDSSIIAGDNGSGLVGVSSNLDDIEITMLNNNLQVLNNSSYKELQLTVTNISGQTVINSQLNNSTETIGMNEFASGIYLVKVNSESKSYIKKIYVR